MASTERDKNDIQSLGETWVYWFWHLLPCPIILGYSDCRSAQQFAAP
jgi:hypothetical protein